MFKVISVFNTPLCSVEEVISAIHSKELKKHPNYKIFLAHLKEFFMLGRPEYWDKYGVKPHFVKMQDWVASFSYVLKPDVALSLSHYIYVEDQKVCRNLFKFLFMLLRQPYVSALPKKNYQVSLSVKGIPDLNLIGIIHGPADALFSKKFVATLLKHLEYSTVIFEYHIDKSDSRYLNPRWSKTKQAHFLHNQQQLSPFFKRENMLNFNRSDRWKRDIVNAYRGKPGFNFANTVVMGAKDYRLRNQQDFSDNISKNPHLRTWAALTDFPLSVERYFRDNHSQIFADDFLHNIVMAADLALQIFEKSAELSQSSSKLSVVIGAAHLDHVSQFLSNRQFMEDILTQLANRIKADTGVMLKFD